MGPWIDGLKRTFEPDQEVVCAIGETDDFWYTRKMKLVQEVPCQYPDSKLEGDRLYCHRSDHLTDPLLPDLEAWILVLPLELRNKSIGEAHDTTKSGHLGVDKTFQRLSLPYYWPGMFNEVAKYVRACKIGQKIRKTRQVR